MRRTSLLLALLVGCGSGESDPENTWSELNGTYQVGTSIDCYVKIDHDVFRSDNGAGQTACLSENMSAGSTIRIERLLEGTLSDGRVQGVGEMTELQVTSECQTTRTLIAEGAAEKRSSKPREDGPFAFVAGAWTGRVKVTESTATVCRGEAVEASDAVYELAFVFDLFGQDGRLDYQRVGVDADHELEALDIDEIQAGEYLVAGENIHLLD